MKRVRAMLWALFALVLGGLAYLLGVGSSLGQRAEDSALDASAFTTSPPPPLSLVSPLAVILAFAVIAVIAVWVHGALRAIVIVGFGAVAILASQLLKDSWLERPVLLEFEMQNTFPSGHMTVFGVVAAGVLWAVPAAWRLSAAWVAAVLLSIVSWQLLEFGWHRPSDVLGAQALVVLAFALAAWIGPHRSKRSGAGAVSGAVNRILGIVLTVLGLVVVIVGLALVAVAATVQSSELMLNAGEIALVGVSALTARTLARLCP